MVSVNTRCLGLNIEDQSGKDAIGARSDYNEMQEEKLAEKIRDAVEEELESRPQPATAPVKTPFYTTYKNILEATAEDSENPVYQLFNRGAYRYHEGGDASNDRANDAKAFVKKYDRNGDKILSGAEELNAISAMKSYNDAHPNLPSYSYNDALIEKALKYHAYHWGSASK